MKSQQLLVVTCLMLAFSMAAHITANAQLSIHTPGVTYKRIYDSLAQMPDVVNDTAEGGKLRRLHASKVFWSARASRNDSSGVNMFTQYHQALNSAVHARYAGPCSGGGQFQGAWTCTGPDILDKQAMGYVECVWSDPSDPDTILAGTYGGLFKTVDGGASWICITDNAPIAKGIGGMISSIAVHPTNKNIIYLGTKSEFWINLKVHGQTTVYGSSLLTTTDGGQTWTQEIVGSSGEDIDFIQKVYFTPSGNNVFVFKKNEIFTRQTVGTTWQKITNSTNNPIDAYTGGEAIWRDLEFVPGDLNADNHFFIAASHYLNAPTATGIYEVTKSGATWNINSIITIGAGHNSIGADTCLRVEISIPDASNLFALFLNEKISNLQVTDPNQDFRIPGPIARYDLTTSQWHVVNANPSYGVWDPNQHSGEFVVSPNKVQATSGGVFHHNMYIGGTDILQSYDGGQTFVSLGNYWGPNTHGDVRSISLHTSTNSLRGKDDVVFFATDGGVAKKPANRDAAISGHFTCDDISGRGLTCATFWGLSTSEAGGMITSGAQHQGMFSYEPDKNPKWLANGYGDGSTTVFDETDKTLAWGTAWTASSYYKTSSGGGRAISSWNWETGFPNEARKMDFAVPLFADKVTNSQYTGQQNLRRKLDGLTTWDNLSVGGNPDLGLTFFNTTHIRNFAFSPHEGPNPVGYVIFEREDLGSVPASTSKNLWRRLSATTFSSVTSPTNGAYPMTDVTLDPSDVQRVWVSLGGTIPSSPTMTKDRVSYSTNGGTTWHDVSKGLPDRLPVTNIVFQEGTNNVYCATDVGIFKCDFTNFNPGATLVNGVNPSVEWICFNTLKELSTSEFPTVYVTGMEINYCTGKLFVATHGRGIWETNIMVDPYPANNPPTFLDEYRPIPRVVYTSSDAILGEKYITTGIRVTNNATLTIGDGGTTPTTVHMPRNGVIQVDKGATLIVDGATITNSCDGSMWYGICAEGTTNQPQGTPLSHSHQGYVKLQNEATLEHARIALLNGTADADLSKTGGMIHADNANFVNNACAASFLQYHAFPNFYSSNSFFKDCNFTIDNVYRGVDVDHPFQNHVQLWEVKGLKFYGNTFDNTLNGQGNGIYSFNAGYTVKRWMGSTDYAANNFTHLQNGIWVDGDNKGLPLGVLVDQSSFVSNTIGIKIVNQENVVAVRNEFTIGDAPGTDVLDCDDNIGIYTLNTKQFRIEENSFEGATFPSVDYYIGTVVHNSGINDKEVYKNTYTDLTHGVVGLGANNNYVANSTASLLSGLRVLCNNFTDNERDISSLGLKADYEGICRAQGSINLTTGNLIDAGNRFNTPGAIHIENTANAVTYYYLSSDPVTQPTNHAGSANYIFVTSLPDANSCASRLTGAVEPTDPVFLTATGKTNWKSTFYTAQTARNTHQSTLNSTIDNGSAAARKSAIMGLTYGSPARSYMMARAPNSSEEVLIFLALQNKMNTTMLTDVMAANPDVMRSPLMILFLRSGAMPTPLSNPQINTVRTASSTNTARTTLEAKLSFAQAAMSNAANILLTDIKHNTINETPKDSIPIWLGRIGEWWAQYHKAYYHFNVNDTPTSNTTINGIAGPYSLSTAETNDLNALKTIYTLHKTLRNQGRTIHDLTTPERNTLTTIRGQSHLTATPVANSILAYVDAEIPPCLDIVAAPGRPAREEEEFNDPVADLQQISGLKIYPNPAHDYVVFEYKLADGEEPIMVTVSNTSGQQVGFIELKADAQGVHQWDVRHLSPGSYMYKAKSAKKYYGSGKIVIIR